MLSACRARGSATPHCLGVTVGRVTGVAAKDPKPTICGVHGVEARRPHPVLMWSSRRPIQPRRKD